MIMISKNVIGIYEGGGGGRVAAGGGLFAGGLFAAGLIAGGLFASGLNAAPLIYTASELGHCGINENAKASEWQHRGFKTGLPLFRVRHSLASHRAPLNP